MKKPTKNKEIIPFPGKKLEGGMISGGKPGILKSAAFAAKALGNL